MKRLCVWLVILVCLLSCCRKDKDTQIVRTGFGDELEIYYHFKESRDRGLSCSVKSDQTDDIITFWDESIPYMPSDITDHLQEITCLEGTRVYKLGRFYIVLQGNSMECFSDTYSMNMLKGLEAYNDVKSDVINRGMEAMCKTGKFEYIERFAPFLSYFENHALDDTLMRWAEGDFTKEELELNQGYTKEQMIEWCKEYLNM